MCAVTCRAMAAWKGIIHAYGDRMNINKSVAPVTLCEGNTPLIPLPKLGGFDRRREAELFAKFEGLNPTGSFKDRGMTTAITQSVAGGRADRDLRQHGQHRRRRRRLRRPRGANLCGADSRRQRSPWAKLAGAIAYGARVIAIDGSFDAALRMVREVSDRAPIALVNSVNPARLEGQKTAAWEVCEQLGGFPDWLCLPVGNAGNISSYWMGFSECPGPCRCEVCPRPSRKPQLFGAQAAGAAPLVTGLPCPNPETRATAIRIGAPARADQALTAIRESNGQMLAVTDEEIFRAYHLVAETEGVFCEPSSAAGLAGLHQAVQNGTLDPEGKRIVCVLTGHGLKDPDSAVAEGADIQKVEANVDALLRGLNL